MAKTPRYQIWDKQSDVITPIGEVLTPEQWMDRYPMARIPSIDLVISGGTINGAFCSEYTSFKDLYEDQGAEFPEGATQREVLDIIEQFEDDRRAKAEAYISPEERTAAALETIAIIQMPDEEEPV